MFHVGSFLGFCGLFCLNLRENGILKSAKTFRSFLLSSEDFRIFFCLLSGLRADLLCVLMFMLRPSSPPDFNFILIFFFKCCRGHERRWRQSSEDDAFTKSCDSCTTAVQPAAAAFGRCVNVSGRQPPISSATSRTVAGGLYSPLFIRNSDFEHTI